MQNGSCRVLPNSGLIGRNAKWFSARRWLGSVADYLLSCAVLFFPFHRTTRRRRLPNEKTSVGCRRPPKRTQKNTGGRHPRALGSRRYCGKTATLRWGIAFSGCSRRLPFSCLCCEAFHFSGVFSHSFQHTRFSGGHVGAGVCVCLISRSVRRAARIL